MSAMSIFRTFDLGGNTHWHIVCERNYFTFLSLSLSLPPCLAPPLSRYSLFVFPLSLSLSFPSLSLFLPKINYPKNYANRWSINYSPESARSFVIPYTQILRNPETETPILYDSIMFVAPIIMYLISSSCVAYAYCLQQLAECLLSVRDIVHV